MGCGRGRIRTSEGFANRFTVCPIWPLWYPPIWADRRTRTADRLITNQLLYQLSYIGLRFLPFQITFTVSKNRFAKIELFLIRNTNWCYFLQNRLYLSHYQWNNFTPNLYFPPRTLQNQESVQNVFRMISDFKWKNMLLNFLRRNLCHLKKVLVAIAWFCLCQQTFRDKKAFWLFFVSLVTQKLNHCIPKSCIFTLNPGKKNQSLNVIKNINNVSASVFFLYFCRLK